MEGELRAEERLKAPGAKKVKKLEAFFHLLPFLHPWDALLSVGSMILRLSFWLRRNRKLGAGFDSPQEAQMTQRGRAATKRIEFWGLEMGVMGASLRRTHPNPPALRRGV